MILTAIITSIDNTVYSSVMQSSAIVYGAIVPAIQSV